MKLDIIQNGKTAHVEFRAGQTILEVLQKSGYSVSADCGGGGKCGKCKVSVSLNGKTGEMLSCKATAQEGMTIALDENFRADFAPAAIKGGNFPQGEIGLVLDIGTTTTEYRFVNLDNGETLLTLNRLNPQRVFGADVMSRVSYATEHGVKDLTDRLRENINEVIENVLPANFKIKKLCVTGNTVMLHTFAGEEIESFGYVPFTPKFLEKREFSGSDLKLNAETVVCLPSFSSFVGADIVCGAVAADLTETNSMLVDIGTNGEILLNANGKLYATSVAAGPAFEGAGIECGTGGVRGAINRVRLKDGKFECDVIGGGSATGICGSGLIDAVACLLETGAVDETGAMKKRVYLTENVYLSDRDIRAFQLAKSAVCAGIVTLLSAANVTANDLDRLCIAGNFGYYIDRENAAKVGLIPKKLLEKAVVIGNSALEGAAMCLMSDGALKRAETLSKRAETVDLSANPEFNENFMENMFF